MSSQAVRVLFKDKLGTFSTPYIDTINLPVGKPSKTLTEWITAEFFADTRERSTFCGNVAESGTVEIEIYTTAGNGDTAGMQIAEDLTAFLSAWLPVGLTVQNIDAPQEIDDGDAEGFFYGLNVVAHYSTNN